MNTPADYDVWLTRQAREFESAQPEVFQRVRLLVSTLLGMPREPIDKVTALALEMRTREAIQILKAWPTQEQFIRGEQ